MPPLTALVPSRTALSLRKRFSLLLVFHEMTVAPYNITSTDSPVGRVAVTLEPSTYTEGCGPAVVGEMAEGLCDRSILSRICCKMAVFEGEQGADIILDAVKLSLFN